MRTVLTAVEVPTESQTGVGGSHPSELAPAALVVPEHHLVVPERILELEAARRALQLSMDTRQ